jgi:ATP-dependent exoDNAse (exonuclease V) beta subunit
LKGTLPKNVLTAVGAKGLEFQRVILYKFGEGCPAKLWRGELKPGERIEAEYFFNKLYVAATRATHHLFMLETQAGDEGLWKHFDETQLVSFIEKLEKADAWTVRPGTDFDPKHEYSVRAPSIGTESEVQEMFETDREKIAETLFKQGKEAENPKLMYKAASYYRELDLVMKTDISTAYAEKFIKNYKKAGTIFRKWPEYTEEARACFWQGKIC